MKRGKLKTSKARENIIRQAVELAFRMETEDLMENDDAPPLRPDFEQQLFARMDAALCAPKPRLKRAALPYLIAAILLTMLVCGTAMACPAIKERIVHLNRKDDPAHTNVHYTATVEGQERRAFDLVEYYTLTDIPEGFVLYDSYEGPWTVSRLWLKPDSEICISFHQIPLNTLFILSTKGCSEETVTLHGREVTHYFKPGREALLWKTDDCMYYIGYWSGGTELADLDIFALEASMVKCGEP